MFQCSKCFHQYCVSNDSLASCNVCEDGDMFSPLEESEERFMKMKKEKIVHLLNSTLDVLVECFGERWLVQWAIDQGLTNEEIQDWVYDDMEFIIKIRKETEEEEENGNH